MKRYIIILMLAVAPCSLFTSCSEESLDPNSVITEFNNHKNELDKWLEAEFLAPYNIDFRYRYNDTSIDTEKVLTPTKYSEAILMAKLTLDLTMGSYDELTGSKEFMRTYYPKQIQLVGCPSYNEDGTELLGQAEGGKAIYLFGINTLSKYLDANNITAINEKYFKTMHHEFTHILHDTKPYSPTFESISSKLYVGDNCWTTYVDDSGRPSDAIARKSGFITVYAATEPNEDFAELISVYVITSPDMWSTYLANAGAKGAEIITQKLDIIKDYLAVSWDIDLDDLRDIVLRRSAEVIKNGVDPNLSSDKE